MNCVDPEYGVMLVLRRRGHGRLGRRHSILYTHANTYPFHPGLHPAGNKHSTFR